MHPPEGAVSPSATVRHDAPSPQHLRLFHEAHDGWDNVVDADYLEVLGDPARIRPRHIYDRDRGYRVEDFDDCDEADADS